MAQRAGSRKGVYPDGLRHMQTLPVVFDDPLRVIDVPVSLGVEVIIDDFSHRVVGYLVSACKLPDGKAMMQMIRDEGLTTDESKDAVA